MARNQVLLLARHYPEKLLVAVDVAHRRGTGIMGRGGVAAWRAAGVVEGQTPRGPRVLRVTRE